MLRGVVEDDPRRPVAGGGHTSNRPTASAQLAAGRRTPFQNRVTPLSELIADPARGLVYGNRGCLHDELSRIQRRYNGRRWIACRLRFRGWHRHPLMQPGKFTELFFLDEATAFSAGHRPCALCRREDYRHFVAIWQQLHPGPATADTIDAKLHEERLDLASRAQRRHDVANGGLPDGAFVLHAGEPHAVAGRRLVRWTPAGYVSPTPRPTGRAQALTPPSLIAVLQAGWQPSVTLLHPSARRTGPGALRWPEAPSRGSGAPPGVCPAYPPSAGAAM